MKKNTHIETCTGATTGQCPTNHVEQLYLGMEIMVTGASAERSIYWKTVLLKYSTNVPYCVWIFVHACVCVCAWKRWYAQKVCGLP